LVKDADQNQHHAAPDKQDCLLAIMSDHGNIILNVWIAIKELVSPAEDEDSGKQKDNHCESESDTQRRNAPVFNHRYQQ